MVGRRTRSIFATAIWTAGGEAGCAALCAVMSATTISGSTSGVLYSQPGNGHCTSGMVLVS